RQGWRVMTQAGELRLTQITRRSRRVRQFLGWGVHFYTPLGLVCAAGIAPLLLPGGALPLPSAVPPFVLVTLLSPTPRPPAPARLVRIKQSLPGFDGRRLDDLIDFLTYSFLPLMLLWRAEVLGPSDDWLAQGWLLLPLLASAYGFCQTSIKTDDGYFLGFPSYW